MLEDCELMRSDKLIHYLLSIIMTAFVIIIIIWQTKLYSFIYNVSENHMRDCSQIRRNIRWLQSIIYHALGWIIE